MKDRWIYLYLLFLLLQLPVFVLLGRSSLNYEFKSQEAEEMLVTPLRLPAEQEAVEKLLVQVETELQQMPRARSRRARLELDRGVLEWKRGHLTKAIEMFEKSRLDFAKHHGPDSFHAAALDLRIGELLFLQRRYPEAIVRFERSTQTVRDFAGQGESFPVRMTFRHVTALVSLGRSGEAVGLAETYLPALEKRIDDQDRGFLTVTAGSLDLLTVKGLLRRPSSEFETWRQYLTSGSKSEEK